jgi:predicted kinase
MIGQATMTHALMDVTTRRWTIQMTNKLIITRGYPASGKTTWAKQQIANDHTGKTVNVSRDDIRTNYLNIVTGVGSKEQEDVVTMIQHNLVNELLCRGYTVIVDDTNLPLKRARGCADYAKLCNVGFAVVDFDTDVEECIKRDLSRTMLGGRSVGEQVIRGMASRFKFPLPAVVASEEKDSGTLQKYIPDHGLPTAWIVDLDGTVALHTSGRSPYDYSRVHEDTLNFAVAEVVTALAVADNIIFMSGRNDSCYEATLDWLEKVGLGYCTHKLIMRKTGDDRKDSVVKAELFFEKVAPYYHVLGAIDDRVSVVKMWRAIGLTCLQVAEGNF